MPLTIETGAPADAGNRASTLRSLINSVAARGLTMPSIAARGATVRSATYATTGTRAFDVVQAIAGAYSTSTPYVDGTASSTGAGSSATSQVITSKTGTNGVFPIPVFGAYIRIVASNQISLSGFQLNLSWQTPNFENMQNQIVIDPAFAQPAGNAQIELWAFPALNILGRYVYTPAALRLALATTTAVSINGAQTVVVKDGNGAFSSADANTSSAFGAGTASFVTSGATIFTTLLTRGQREVDDVFSSYAATAQRSHSIMRSM